eukprot:UN33920
MDRLIKYWDTSTGKCIESIKCKSSCHYIALSYDGDTLVSAHMDSKVRIWSLRKCKIIERI